ncbi:MAG: glycosyltransferase family 4 protein [Hyphomicrobium sp.]
MTTIIFLNRYFYPDQSATSQMLSGVAFALPTPGVSIKVITSRQLYDAPAASLLPFEIISGVAVHRVWSSRFGRTNLVGRALDYLTFYAVAAVALLRLASSGDVIVAKTDPPMLSVIAAPVARLRRAVLVNWLQDIFPEVAEALGVGKGVASRVAYGAMRILRNGTLRRARFTVAIGDRMADRLIALGAPRASVRVISNYADGDLIVPVAHDRNALRQQWSLDDRFVVGYAGNLGRAHDHRTYLDAIAVLESERTARQGPMAGREVVWLFVGGGASLDALKRETRARGLTSVRFEAYQPRERLAESLAAADAHLVSLRPELEGLIVPSKFYGVAAAGRPTLFVGDPDGEISRLLHKYHCGVSVDEGDSQGLVEAIRKLAASPASTAELGANARTAFETQFSADKAVTAWRDLFSELGAPIGLSSPHARTRQESARRQSRAVG